MQWSKEAAEAISKVPFFVRKCVKKRVEEEALRCGAEEVRPEHVRSCQRRFLESMEDEVKGHQLETCFGSSECPNQALSSDALIQRLEEALERRNLKSFLKTRVNGPLKMHHEFRVSISDCPNACSRPQIVDIGLIGARRPLVTDEPCSQCGVCVDVCREGAVALEGGENRPTIDERRCLACGACLKICPTGTLQEGERGYRILLGGKLGRHPRLGHELAGIFHDEEVLTIIEKCLDHYQRSCLKGERFAEIFDRTGVDTFISGGD
jgi:dissimilatory sulfite reductase (desulfoviridin) alpha/beta subunit